MSFNNRNFNPFIWETPRSSNPPAFANNQPQPNFPFVNNNFPQLRPNFPQQNSQNHGNNQMRPHAPFGDDRPNFRKFNNTPDFRNNIQRGIRSSSNFQNVPPPKWKDNRSNEGFDSSGERKSPLTTSDESRSIVEQLKMKAAKINTKQQPENSGNSDNIDAFAKTASKKLLNEIKTTDKGDIKDLINNPRQPHVKAAITYHALEKLRRGMRKQLKTLGGAEDDADYFDAHESVELKDIPQTLIAQMGQELGVDDMDLSSLDESVVEDKEMAVVENNLGNDFLFGSEQLLMNGFSLLGENENEPDLPPPLPSEPIKPPEPVPPPSQEAIFSSANQPWSPSRPPPPKPSQQRFFDDTWDLESGKNPDPPSANSTPIPVITSKRQEPLFSEKPPSIVSEASVKPDATVEYNSSTPLQDENPVNTQKRPPVEDWNDESSTKAFPPDVSIPQTPSISDDVKQEAVETEQQAQIPKSSETYGDYKRRNNPPNNNNNNNNFNKPRPLNQQNRPQNRLNDWDDDNSTPRSTGSNDSWMNNRRNNNSTNDRNSRNDRSRDTNNFRSNSRDRWNERQNSVDKNDGFNYRFDPSDGGIDKLNAIIQPKTQFKGSFNKNRMGPRDFMNRSGNRERTPTNTEGEFGDLLSLPPNTKDVRPCSIMLKRVIEIDSEMMNIHDKIHGIDKVIQNLQSERVAYQKKYSQLQHDRKIVFDNLLKRAQYNEAATSSERTSESHAHREKSPAHKANVNKKLQNLVDQRKRKNEPEPVAATPVEDISAKKKKLMPIEEPKTAAQRQKEKEEKELKERLEKIRKQKQLRREREEAEKRKLEEEAIRASNDVIIKLENKSHKSQKQIVQVKTEKSSKIIFKSSEMLHVTNYQVKQPKIVLSKVPLAQNFVDQFKSGRYPSFANEEWNKLQVSREKTPVPREVIVKEEPRIEPVAAVVELEIPDIDKDPLAMDDQSFPNPPTPGSNLTTLETDENSNEKDQEINYDEWAGNFNAHESPIVFLQNIDGRHMICAAEDGKLFKYRLTNGRVDGIFDHHTQICNAFLNDQKENIIYTASSDGYVFRIKFKSFLSLGSRNFNESLQVVEKLKSTIYVGAKSGNIYKIKSDLTYEDEDSSEPLCCVEGLILCLKASKEGPRQILLVASRGRAIQVRDASDGLLLRTLANEIANVSVYDMALDGSTIYCGCNLNDIFAIDFTNGALKKKLTMLGAGAICVKIYKQFLIASCYDGNIYIFNNTSDDVGSINITGPSNMMLAMDIWENKIIASTKDKTVKIMNIPT